MPPLGRANKDMKETVIFAAFVWFLRVICLKEAFLIFRNRDKKILGEKRDLRGINIGG